MVFRAPQQATSRSNARYIAASREVSFGRFCLCMSVYNAARGDLSSHIIIMFACLFRSVPVFACRSLSVSVSASLSVCLSLYLTVCLSLYLTVSLSPIPVSLYLCLSFVLFLYSLC